MSLENTVEPGRGTLLPVVEDYTDQIALNKTHDPDDHHFHHEVNIHSVDSSMIEKSDVLDPNDRALVNQDDEEKRIHLSAASQSVTINVDVTTAGYGYE